ncbi:MAG: hypothetical protein SW833_17730 [Cyanobacteriota bacterium]|nr:hypothetical protein [Cyanobacteriota bacterium]
MRKLETGKQCSIRAARSRGVNVGNDLRAFIRVDRVPSSEEL